MPNVGQTNVNTDHFAQTEPRAFLLPQTQSQEKIDLLKMLGAEVYPVPGAYLKKQSDWTTLLMTNLDPRSRRVRKPGELQLP